MHFIGPIPREQLAEQRAQRKQRPLRTHAGEPITKLYRYFKQRKHAEALCEGKVWISTLATCRRYEDPAQGDPFEAHQIYKTGRVEVEDSGDPRIQALANHGIQITGCRDVKVNITSTTHLRDAFVLCTTLKASEADITAHIGRYGVEISEPMETYFDITSRLFDIRHFGEIGFDVVKYTPIEYQGLEGPPGLMGWVKRPDIYEPQQEARMLWIPVDDEPLQPFCLDVPEIVGRCRLMEPPDD